MTTIIDQNDKTHPQHTRLTQLEALAKAVIEEMRDEHFECPPDHVLILVVDDDGYTKGGTSAVRLAPPTSLDDLAPMISVDLMRKVRAQQGFGLSILAVDRPANLTVIFLRPMSKIRPTASA